MSIQIRSTQQSVAARALVGLQGNITRLGSLQQQLTSGKQLTRPSDNPTGTVSAMQLRSEIRSAEQQVRNVADGLGWLGTIDGTLTNASSQLARARDLTVQGLSSGSTSAEARDALAIEVGNIRESLLDAANTRYLNRPVFGGTTSKEDAYTASGTFQGDPGTSVSRTVGNGVPVRVDVTGPEVFGAAPNDVFAVLESVAKNLKSGDTKALAADLAKLDTAFNNIKGTISDIGARYNRLETARTTAEDMMLSLRTQLSDVEDIDLPATIMQLQMQQVAYEAALASTAKVVQPSLMDFLR